MHAVSEAGVEGAVEEAPAPVEGEEVETIRTETTQVPGGTRTVITTETVKSPSAPRRSLLRTASVEAPKNLLKVVARAPEEKAQAKGTGVGGLKAGTAITDKDGFRTIRLDKKSLDQLAEEEAAKKRSGRGEFVRPEDVRFADYRKKEVVFLPKKKRIPPNKELHSTSITTAAAHKRVVEIDGAIRVQDLAAAMSVKAPQLIRKLVAMGQMAGMNDVLDFDTTTLVAAEFQFEVKNKEFREEELLATAVEAANPAAVTHRPPVVTIMGHVDHGKTSLLDAIKKTNVAAGEAGGITQHVGAYTVEKDGKLITFIDTPGHAAFTAMRARGANVTDIVILVVAADDGVMPQTREALEHARAAKVPIVVAINKIDKPQANPEKIKQTLSELNLLPEEWGGDTMFVPVSAVAGTNLDKLLEAILLNAEVLDLKADPTARAAGVVLESRLDKGRGPVMTILVKQGSLHVGDYVVAGEHSGKVRALYDWTGANVKDVGPGISAEILGLDGVAKAGDAFSSTATDADAKAVVENRRDKSRAAEAARSGGKLTMEQILAKLSSGNLKELKVILKADVFGSVEAVRDSLTKLQNEKVKVEVITAATGGITESDILLASASEALIVGFNVRPDTKALQLAEAEGVEVRTYRIIYELLDDVKKAMAGMLDKIRTEKFLGRAEVRQTFTVPKIGTVAGSAVVDGKIVRGASVRLLRNSQIVYEGKMTSLKRFKDDAREVAQGYECGIGLEGYNDIKPGDVIEAFQVEMITPELNL